MKLLNKPAVQLKGNYSNPQLEEYITKEHSQLFIQAREVGMRMGIKRTAEGSTNILTLTESIYSGYNELVSYANRSNQGVLEIASGSIDVAHINQANEKLDVEKGKAEAAWKTSKQRLGDVRVTNAAYYTVILGVFISLLVMVFDVLYISTAFQVTGEPLYKSMLMGIGISVSLAVIGILGSATIETWIERKINRFIAYFLLSLFVSGGLYVICSIRSEYYFQVTGREVSPWSFLLLNMVALVAFHFISRMVILPAWSRIKETRELKKHQKEVRQLKQEYEKVDAEMDANSERRELIKKFKLSVLSYGQSIEELIQRHYEASLAEFKRAYMEESGTVPECFNSPAAILTTYYSEFTLLNKLDVNQ